MLFIKKFFNTTVVVFLLLVYLPPTNAEEQQLGADQAASEQGVSANDSIAAEELATEAIDGQVAHDSYRNAWQIGSGAVVEIATSEDIYQRVPVSSLEGQRVVNLDAKSVGKVRDVMLAETGDAVALVVETGGFFGIGAAESLVPLEDFYFVGEQLVWETRLSKDELKKTEQFDFDENRFSSLLDE